VLIGENDAAFRNWESATKLQISLSTKLRLTPQSRSDAKTIARQPEPPSGAPPWEL